MILKPSWQLLNFHLPVFTEVLGYGTDIAELKTDNDEATNEGVDDGNGYESEDEEETQGVEGMSMQLIELLTTLVSR